MSGQLAAKVYVEKAVYSIDTPFDYLVPEEFSALRRGCRVLVPFGNSNKKVQGLVVSVGEAAYSGQLKSIAAQLDSEPSVSEEMFRIIGFLVETTFCTYYEAVRVVVPVGINVDVIEYYELASRPEESELAGLPAGERRLTDFLNTARTAKELNAFLDCRQNPSKSAAVRSLLQKGILRRTERLKPRIAAKTARLVRLAQGVDPDEMPLPQKQREVVVLLRECSAARPKELAELCGVTEAVVRALLKKGVLESFERELPEDWAERPAVQTANPDVGELSEAQRAVCGGILALSDGKPHTALLHGVTGSGKTLVYIHVIRELLERGKTALLLVPEIALTPQLVERFEGVFGGIVGVLHSGLSVAERLNVSRRVGAGQIKIVIGTRSAVFAPLENIGIVILDEEGETSYKSESAPRYHARDVARLRCAIHGAVLLLGSATPCVDSYYHARRGDYALFELAERYAAAELPQVYLVDMREELNQRSLSPLSRVLQEQLSHNLEAGEQSILLINRRGYNTYATCMQCGEVLKCPSCTVAMTYHRTNASLMCHYCGHTELFRSRCPACGGEYIKLTGTGTQKVEDELALLLPEARVLRMDADTTGPRAAFSRGFGDFGRGRYDILLGTQMVAKGLDFPNVTLVGVLNADGGLYSGDYRSGERVFSLITQVVGRGGRGGKAGRAYIQTFDTDNPILAFAANQDFRAFYEDEITARRALLYPPFCNIAILGVACPDEQAAERAAYRAMELLQESVGERKKITMKALGVAPAPVSKIGGKYRFRIVIKCRMNAELRAALAETLKRCGRDTAFAGVTAYVDVNGEMN